MQIFLTVLLVIPWNKKQPKCLSTNEGIKYSVIIMQCNITWNNIDKTHRPYAKWKTPHSEEYILHDFIYMKFYL